MTGMTVPILMRDEFKPDGVRGIAWGYEYGAIDASPLIPAGSTKACRVGKQGFGRPRMAAREKME